MGAVYSIIYTTDVIKQQNRWYIVKYLPNMIGILLESFNPFHVLLRVNTDFGIPSDTSCKSPFRMEWVEDVDFFQFNLKWEQVHNRHQVKEEYVASY